MCGARVTLIDKGACGAEASWAGGGIVSPLYPWRYEDSITALATWAQRFYPTLARELTEETGIDPELNESGLLMLDAQDEKAALVWAEKSGHEMLKMEPAEFYNCEPDLGQGFQSALSMPRVANIRNPRLCQALAISLRADSNVRLLEHTEIVSLESSEGLVTGLRLKRGGVGISVEKSKLVICAGAWANHLLKSVGLCSDIKPIKGQMLLFKLPKPPIRSIVLSAGKYLIPRKDGHLLVGSTLEDTGFDKTLTLSAQKSLLHAAHSMLPQLKGSEPVGHWAGLRPGSDAGVPLIGEVSGFGNLFINAGQHRNGLVLAPASARLMADILLGREKFIDADPYRPAARLNPHPG